MHLPFSRPEFLQIFSDYNETVWPAQLVAAVLGAIAIALLFSRWGRADRFIATILAIFWGFTGVVYHGLFFSGINIAAYLFGGLFVIAALVFFVEGTIRARIRFAVSWSLRGWLALLLIAYAFVVYPVLGLVATHPYPETPLFGVAPCPTTIFTLALLVLASHPRPLLLAIVPLVWALIGGSAAFLLEIPQDWGLLVAGLVWLVVWVFQSRATTPRATD